MSEVESATELPAWRWAYRLLRITVMVIAAYWLSRTGDAFFYQGF